MKPKDPTILDYRSHPLPEPRRWAKVGRVLTTISMICLISAAFTWIALIGVGQTQGSDLGEAVLLILMMRVFLGLAFVFGALGVGLCVVDNDR